MPGVGGSGGKGKASADAIKAGEAFVEASVDDSGFHARMKAIGDRIKRVGGVVRNIGLGMTGVGLLGLSGLVPVIDSLQEMAKLGNAAEAFGMTGDAASRLFGIMRAGGSDIKDATEGLVTLNQRIEEGLENKGEVAPTFFRELGKSAEDFAKLDTPGRFYALIDALREVKDPAKRVQLLLKAVGEDTGKNLIPVLSLTKKEVKEMGDSFALTSEDLESARQAQKEYAKATAQIKAVWQQVVIAVVPLVKEVSTTVTPLIKSMASFARQNKELVLGFFLVAAGLVALGVSLTAFGFALSGLVTGIVAVKAVIVTLIAVAFNPLTYAILGVTLLIVGLGAAFIAFIDKSRTMGVEFGQMASGMKDSFLLAWGSIINALKKGDLELAGQIAMMGLLTVFQEGVVFLQSTWNKFKGFFVDAFHDAVMIIEVYWNDLFTWVQKRMIEVGGFIARNVASLTDELGITDNEAAKHVGMVEKINRQIDKEARDREKKIFADARAAQDARDKAREADLAAAKADLDKFKGVLGKLVQKALPEVEEKPWEKEAKKKALADSFGDAVRGTFGSADYKGLLGIGPANDAAKEAAKQRKEMVKQLVEANKKLEKLKMPEFQ